MSPGRPPRINARKSHAQRPTTSGALLPWPQLAAGVLFVTVSCGQVLAQQVSLVGISGERALLVIDQSPPRFLSPGQSHGVVKLLQIDGQQAKVDIGGKPAVLMVGEAPVSVGGGTTSGGGKRVVLTADSRGHFMTPGVINGKTVQFMVDTGATSIILGQAEATRIGLNVAQAEKIQVSTANGIVHGQQFKLATVRLGDVEVRDVTAVVLPQPMPYVLLGNSFLTRFQMRRENDQMTLEKRF